MYHIKCTYMYIRTSKGGRKRGRERRREREWREKELLNIMREEKGETVHVHVRERREKEGFKMK